MPITLDQKLHSLLEAIYPDHDANGIADRIIGAYWPDDRACRPEAREPGNDLWSARDCLVITYGNSLTDGVHKPLDLLYNFLSENLSDVISGVHILPFFPYTSDDGFAVTDYEVVNSTLGDWPDIRRIAEKFTLMSDLVLNHVSSQSKWFNAYLQGHAPYDRYFYQADPKEDLRDVVRPRAHPLLREVETASGMRHVWCTFSHDQVDLDFSNPEVLIEFIRIMRLHVDNGVRIIRLDAVAFIWKVIGTPCIHLPQVHAIVRLLRVLADYSEEPVVLLTETNVPNRENISYFGNRNEAHAVYNFSLPPLLLHALLKGTSEYLNAWQRSMPPAQLGCAYLNFTASHDGIGMRPAEGLLPQDDIDAMIETVQQCGGRLSMRALPDGGEKPYELNIALIDALIGTLEGPDEWQFERFLCSQSIMMMLEGIPAFYIHSLLATPNHHDGVAASGHNRTINRRQWNFGELNEALDDPHSLHARVFDALRDRIRLRIRQPAFHPNATQFTLTLGDDVFGVWRQSMDRAQSIFAIANLTADEVLVPKISINLIDGDNWCDLIDGQLIDPTNPDIPFEPYQVRWISNCP